MNKEINVNDNKLKEFRKNKFERLVLILLSIIVIILEILALFKVINMIWGMIVFFVIYLLKKFILKN